MFVVFVYIMSVLSIGCMVLLRFGVCNFSWVRCSVNCEGESWVSFGSCGEREVFGVMCGYFRLVLLLSIDELLKNFLLFRK